MVAILQLLGRVLGVIQRVGQHAGGADDDGRTIGAILGEGRSGDGPTLGLHPGGVERSAVAGVGIAERERRGGGAGAGVAVVHATGFGQFSGRGGGGNRRRVVGAGDGEDQVLGGGVGAVRVGDREGVARQRRSDAARERVGQRLRQRVGRDLGRGVVGNGAVGALLREDGGIGVVSRPTGGDERDRPALLVGEGVQRDRGGRLSVDSEALLDQRAERRVDGERRGVVAAGDRERDQLFGGQSGVVLDEDLEGIGGRSVLGQGFRVGVGVVQDVGDLVGGDHEGGGTVGARLRVGDAGVAGDPAVINERIDVVADDRRGIGVGAREGGGGRGGAGDAGASLDEAAGIRRNGDRRVVVRACDREGNRLRGLDRRGERLAEVDREVIGDRLVGDETLGIRIRVAQRIVHHARGDGVGGRTIGADLGVGKRIAGKDPACRGHRGGVDLNGRVGFGVGERDGRTRGGSARLRMAGLLEVGRGRGRGDRRVVGAIDIEGRCDLLNVSPIRDLNGERVLDQEVGRRERLSLSLAIVQGVCDYPSAERELKRTIFSILGIGEASIAGRPSIVNQPNRIKVDRPFGIGLRQLDRRRGHTRHAVIYTAGLNQGNRGVSSRQDRLIVDGGSDFDGEVLGGGVFADVARRVGDGDGDDLGVAAGQGVDTGILIDEVVCAAGRAEVEGREGGLDLTIVGIGDVTVYDRVGSFVLIGGGIGERVVVDVGTNKGARNLAVIGVSVRVGERGRRRDGEFRRVVDGRDVDRRSDAVGGITQAVGGNVGQATQGAVPIGQALAEADLSVGGHGQVTNDLRFSVNDLTDGEFRTDGAIDAVKTETGYPDVIGVRVGIVGGKALGSVSVLLEVDRIRDRRRQVVDVQAKIAV